MVPNPLST